jgi:hypothetical protein
MWVLNEMKWLSMRGPLAVLVNMVMHSWVPEKVGNILKNFVSKNIARNLLLRGPIGLLSSLCPTAYV